MEMIVTVVAPREDLIKCMANGCNETSKLNYVTILFNNGIHLTEIYCRACSKIAENEMKVLRKPYLKENVR